METSKVYQLLDGQIDEKDDSGEEDGLKIYHVRWRKREDREGGFRVFSIGQPSDQPTKCVLLLGVTGAGKTTIVNGFLNNFFGVKFKDSFRLQVKEVTNRKETESQTDFITVYTIYYKKGMKYKYNLVLIDTPGLADTKGTQQARNIRRYLEEFIVSDFGIHDLHCLGLVAKSNINRDLESEKAVLGEIMSLVGEAVPEITHIFATFAADTPTVDKVVRNAGVNYKSMFQFDNGVLYDPANTNTCPEKKHISVSYRWDNMSEQYEACFDALANVSPLSLELIRKRKLFDTHKRKLKTEVKQLATLVTEMEINMNAHRKYEKQKDVNKDWKKMERKASSRDHLALNCQSCKKTCMILKKKNGVTKVLKVIGAVTVGAVAVGLLAAGAGAGAILLVGTGPVGAGVAGTAVVGAEVVGVGTAGAALVGTVEVAVVGAGAGVAGGGVAGAAVAGAAVAGAEVAGVGAAVVGAVEVGAIGAGVGAAGAGGVGAGVGAAIGGGIGAVGGGAAGAVVAIIEEEGDVPEVCEVDGCSHTKAHHTKESITIQEKIDSNKKKLYDVAVSKLEDVTTKINNGKQEIMSCITTISHITVKLLNSAKKIEQLTGHHFVSINAICSEFEREIRLGENNIIPQATKCITILSKAMRRHII